MHNGAAMNVLPKSKSARLCTTRHAWDETPCTIIILVCCILLCDLTEKNKCVVNIIICKLPT